MKKTTIAEIALGAGLLGAIGTGAYAAQAHDGTFDAACTGYSLHLTNYPNHSSLTGTIDGAPVEAIFNGKYDLSSAWAGDKHSISLSVVSGDGDKRYNKTFTKEIAGCLPTSTPPTPTPSEPPATGTTTTSPTPSSPTSSESASPSTVPSSPQPSATPEPVGTPTPTKTSTPAPSTVPTPAASTSSPKGSPSIAPTEVHLPTVSG